MDFFDNMDENVLSQILDDFTETETPKSDCNEDVSSLTDVCFDILGPTSNSKSHGRFAEITSPDVMEFLETNENKNTKRKTKTDIELIQTFLVTKNETRLLEYIPPNELNQYLAEFILSVKKQDGNEYEPSTLQSYMSSADRYLKAKGYPHSIQDIEFTKARSVLKMKQKQLKSLGKGNKPRAADPLEDAHIQLMYDCGTLGSKTPKALLHSLWMVCTTHFGMRTGQEVKTLCWGDIQCMDDSNGEYLIYNTERQTKTRTGANARNNRTSKPRAYALPENKEKDPVYLYKLYAEKRPKDMTKDDSPFFLSPAHENPKPGQAWYKRSPMGINKLYGIMKEMKSDAGIETSKRITPYSARKHLIQKLNDSGVPSHQIVQISGHKHINSLNNYSKLNPDQNKMISDIISNKKPTCSEPSPTPNSVVAQSCRPMYPFGQSMNPSYPHMNENSFPFPTGSNHFPVLIGSTFNGPVNFYFDKSSKSHTHTLSQTAISTRERSCSSSPEVRRWKRIRCISDSSE